MKDFEQLTMRHLDKINEAVLHLNTLLNPRSPIEIENLSDATSEGTRILDTLEKVLVESYTVLKRAGRIVDLGEGQNATSLGNIIPFRRREGI